MGRPDRLRKAHRGLERWQVVLMPTTRGGWGFHVAASPGSRERTLAVASATRMH